MGAGGKRAYWVGFDLGGTKMQATVFDSRLNPVGCERRRTKAHAGKAATIARLVETIRRAMQDAGVTLPALAGIGIGTPGPLDLKKGVLLEAPNLDWENLPLRRTMEKAFGCPVTLVNDVDAGVYGEYRFGAAEGARCALGVFPGTGIGGGCVYEGRILTGGRRSCLEIGHCRVLPEGPLCGCGQRGCLEAVASRLAIAAAAAVAAARGHAPHLLSMAGTDIARMRSSVLAAAVKAGDRTVEAIVRDAAAWLGVGIATAINLLAPDVVLLGGGLVEAMPDLFLREVEQSARQRVLPCFRGSFAMRVAKLGDNATTIGAAALARDTSAGSG